MIIYTEEFFSDSSLYPTDKNIVRLVDSYTNENVNFVKTDVWIDGSLMNYDKIDGAIYRFRKGNNNEDIYYRRVYENELNVLWFKAYSNGVYDDKIAFERAHDFAAKNLQYHVFERFTIIIPEKCQLDFMVNNQRGIQGFVKNIILKFTGGSIKNAILQGDYTMVDSAPYRIFENVELQGNWISSDGYACPEWFGTIPKFDVNDSDTIDLKDSLDSLHPFEAIKFNKGIYDTYKGHIQVTKFVGLSKHLTTIRIKIRQSQDNIKYGLCIGVYEGLVCDRIYFNRLENINIHTVSDIRKKSYSAVVMGASHGAVIQNINILQNSYNMSLNKDEITHILENVEGRYKDANIGLEYRGCSELTTVSQLGVFSDVGIGFNTIDNGERPGTPAPQEQGVDFPSIYDFYTGCGEFGLASVFFGAPNVYGLKMSGIQSWAEGIFGLYSCSNITPNSFWNCSIDNVRIEQLNACVFEKDIPSNNSNEEKIVSTSIHIENQSNIENLVFNSILFSGYSNGLYLGNIEFGYFEINNVTINSDNKPVKYFISTFHGEYSPFVVRMRNVTCRNNFPVITSNGVIVENNYYDKSLISPYHINFRDVSIIRKVDVLFKKEINKDIFFKQNLNSPGASLWVKLTNSKVTEWEQGEIFRQYDIKAFAFRKETITNLPFSFEANVSLRLYSDESYVAQDYDENKIYIGSTDTMEYGKINIVFQESTRFWFLVNIIEEEVDYDIKGFIRK